ncbi:MAG: hypothetical protein ACYDGN_13040 [Acidimicrobiales bacterium]
MTNEDRRFVEADVDVYRGLSIAFYRSRLSGAGVDVPTVLPEGWHKEHDWVWRVNLLGQLLDSYPGRLTTVSGDARNRHDALWLFDKVFVLYAAEGTLRERIAHRQGNRFGQDPVEFAWIARENERAPQEAEKMGAFLIDTTELTRTDVVSICEREIPGAC